MIASIMYCPGKIEVFSIVFGNLKDDDIDPLVFLKIPKVDILSPGIIPGLTCNK
jgi:hypothetical protein